VRNDCGVYEGAEVTVHYDPMLAKLIVWAADRLRALARLGRALGELRIEGIETTVPLYRALLADPDFLAGRLDVGMLDRKLAAGELRPREEPEAPDLPFIAAALVHFERSNRLATGGAGSGGRPAAGSRRGEWRRAGRREALRRGPWS